MNILIFKTNIKSKRKVSQINPIFQGNPKIFDWSVDTEDIDNVLRIEASNLLKEREVIHMVKNHGFYCEILSN